MISKLPIACPSCQGGFDVSLEDARNNATVTCPSCGQDIDLKGDSAAKEFDKVNQSLASITKGWGKRR